ncbi:MAG: hypothetical protein EPO32_07180 [Anaerolineae bacterium]|nr:MAG: hypothetical protein EPO32_07180 [Anaerolineae bacterium]
MYNDDTELLFPSRVIRELRDERAAGWAELVDRVKDTPPDHPDHLAFVLMMAKLNGCTSCNADSFRAMRGCTQCAIQNVKRNKGGDGELVKLFEKALKEVSKFAPQK